MLKRVYKFSLVRGARLLFLAGLDFFCEYAILVSTNMKTAVCKNLLLSLLLLPERAADFRMRLQTGG